MAGACNTAPMVSPEIRRTLEETSEVETMSVSHSLNEYHLEFLRLLVSLKVRFLIIGGQARYIHLGRSTHDLDLWTDISDQNKFALEQSLSIWKRRYPVHTLSDLSPPIALRPNLQIKFPDADAWYMGSDGKPAEILTKNEIDVLTSVGEADFDACFARAVAVQVDGLDVSFLAAVDLETISPTKVSP